jgi:hypothetical protein
MESDTLELPTTNMEAGVSSRAQLKITRVVEPKTDLLYLV